MVDKHFFMQTKLFGDLKSREWEELYKIAKEQKFEEGHIIFPQGDTSTDLYIAVKGEVEIQISIAPQLADITVYRVRPHEVFGEFAFVDPDPRSATARCKTDVTLVMIKKDDFDELIKKFPAIGVRFYQSLGKILCVRLRRMNTYLRDIFLRSLGLEV
jgi:CRP/FNR family cyclic AMP-dependent transcriptional regulator